MDCLLVEKYRPKTLDEYIGNDKVKDKVKVYFETKEIPHLLLWGGAGGGKTTLAKIIINTLEADYKYINASDENGIETVRTKIKDFAGTAGFNSGIKIIVLDECDFLTPLAQGALRGIIEEYSGHTRFILTCNYIQKLITPLISRIQKFEIKPPSKNAVAKHLLNILDKEKITYNKKDVATIINTHYPDIRQIIQTCELQTMNDVLSIDNIVDVNNAQQKILDELMDYNRDGETIITNIRQIIADNRIQLFEPLFGYIFNKIHEQKLSMNIRSEISIVLADYQAKDPNVVNKEINAAAMFYKIIQIFQNN